MQNYKWWIEPSYLISGLSKGLIEERDCEKNGYWIFEWIAPRLSKVDLNVIRLNLNPSEEFFKVRKIFAPNTFFIVSCNCSPISYQDSLKSRYNSLKKV